MSFEASHLIALVPGIAFIIRGPRALPSEFRWLALAYAVSYPIDSIAKQMDGSWAPFYILIPVQIAFVIFALEPDGFKRLVAIPPLAAAVPISWTLTFPDPEILIMATGSIAILCMLVFKSGHLSWPTLIYFGIGSITYVLMVTGSDFMHFWYGYFTARIGAMLVFIAIMFTWRQEGDVCSSSLKSCSDS